MAKTFREIIEQSRLRELNQLVAMGLTLEDAEDIYQEASMVLYNTLSSQRLMLNSSPEAYLHGTCNNMAHKRLDELKKKCNAIDEGKLDRLLELTESDECSPALYADNSAEEVDYLAILSNLLQELSYRDYQLIHGYYIDGKTMETLTAELGMASIEVLRTTKCRIISRLREKANILIGKYL